jgi:hypothetical protein
MIFINNKYTTWYSSIINKAKNRNINSYTENHHIIPVSVGGNNSSDNIVALSAREHYVCHLLLTKMTTGKAKKSMAYALWMMTNASSKGQKRYKCSSKLYEIARRHFCDAQKGHLNYLLEQTPDARNKISKSMKTNLAKLTKEEMSSRLLKSFHSPESWTAERKEKISKALTGKIRSAETKSKISLAQQNRTPEQKLTCGDSNRGKTWKLVDGKRVWFPKEGHNFA